jgi:hypothetical protein
MTWNTYHRRGEVLQTVVETTEARRDGRLPLDLPGVAETFRDELDLLGALHLKWHARLSGNIERALMNQPLDLADAVAQAWRRTSDELTGIRLVLDHYSEQPTGPEMARALAKASEKEWAGLASAAGLASDAGAQAVRVGRSVADRGRSADPALAARAVSAPRTIDEPDSRSLVERIKAALVA